MRLITCSLIVSVVAGERGERGPRDRRRRGDDERAAAVRVSESDLAVAQEGLDRGPHLGAVVLRMVASARYSLVVKGPDPGSGTSALAFEWWPAPVTISSSSDDAAAAPCMWWCPSAEGRCASRKARVAASASATYRPCRSIFGDVRHACGSSTAAAAAVFAESIAARWRFFSSECLAGSGGAYA